MRAGEGKGESQSVVQPTAGAVGGLFGSFSWAGAASLSSAVYALLSTGFFGMVGAGEKWISLIRREIPALVVHFCKSVERRCLPYTVYCLPVSLGW